MPGRSQQVRAQEAALVERSIHGRCDGRSLQALRDRPPRPAVVLRLHRGERGNDLLWHLQARSVEQLAAEAEARDRFPVAVHEGDHLRKAQSARPR